MDPVLEEQSDLDPNCSSVRLHDKNIHFVIMRFKG